MSEELKTPKELAEIYKVSSVTILQWYHSGEIPAEVAVGKTFRFDGKKVADALAKKAAKAPKVLPRDRRAHVA